VKGRINEWLSKLVATLAKDWINVWVGMRMNKQISTMIAPRSPDSHSNGSTSYSRVFSGRRLNFKAPSGSLPDSWAVLVTGECATQAVLDVANTNGHQ
jgi:hypothetical protein